MNDEQLKQLPAIRQRVMRTERIRGHIPLDQAYEDRAALLAENAALRRHELAPADYVNSAHGE